MSIPSWPEAFSDRLRIDLGQEADLFFASLLTPAPVSIRVNDAKGLIPQGLESVPWSTSGYYLPERPSFIWDPLWHAGGYYVQEASSMFLEQAWKRISEEITPTYILDLCGAPGGKTTHLASLMDSDALLVANEVIAARSRVLAENVARWGTSQVLVSQNDPKDFSRLKSVFDVMVVDAPCSGEGLFRREPEAADEWSEAHLQLCSDRQRRILADVWPALRPGGFLIYSTCTFNPGENEENLAWLNQAMGAETMEIALDPAWGIKEIVVGNLKGYQCMPHRVKGEGFFLALVRKPGDAPPQPPTSKGTWATKKTREPLLSWLKDPEDSHLYETKSGIYTMRGATPEIWAGLMGQLRLVQAGIPLAEQKGKDWIPKPEAAFLQDLNPEPFGLFDLDLENARSFLHRDGAALEGPMGWGLVRYQQMGLGWVKHLGNRTNNYYPQNWRIRQDRPADLPPSIFFGS